ncbi:hypothetical protein [Atlantibacter subterraneus]|uniref:hypothetical protein n=1 Tax=Atlantibacter subterraneus TaxID=255519 RepID=UPI00289D5926|nr:hypothetical protein [Atlantibacter subterranea]
MAFITVKKHTVKRALSMGFEKVLDDRGYDSGAYYFKDGKKWIFDIVALKQKQGVTSDDELKNLGYDVDTYNLLKNESNELAELYQDIAVEDGEPMYLEGGVDLYPDGSIR